MRRDKGKTTKTCVKCKQEKEYSLFHKNRTRCDGLQSICKACRSTSVLDLEVTSGVTKRCTSCKTVFPVSCFNKDRGRLVSRCKACCKIAMDAWLDKKNPERHNKPIYGDEHLLLEGVNKRCSNCKTIRTLSDFNKLSASGDGLASQCRYCTTEYCKANKETYARLNKKWVRINRHKVRAKGSKRRAIKLRATPGWLTPRDLEHIAAIHYQAVSLENITGIKYHVDHCVPLQGANICGLHVPWNLSPITAADNSSKKNKLILSEALYYTPFNEVSWLEFQKGKNE